MCRRCGGGKLITNKFYGATNAREREREVILIPLEKEVLQVYRD
jgi:hypothetical protein